MIGLGLRLAVGSRAARTRLVLVAIGVALGTVFLLGALGYMHARGVVNHRVATRTPQLTGGPVDRPGILWSVTPVSYSPGDTAYTLIRTAPGHGPQPVPLGAPRMPAPGSAYVSPAVAAKMAANTPDGAVWRALVPWHVVGILNRAVLHDPNERVVMAGYRHAQLSARSVAAFRISSWTQLAREAPGQSLPTYQLIPFAMAIALSLTPIAIFIASAARIGQRRRDERASALRLLGASTRQLAFLAACETAIAAFIGAVIGVGVIELLRLRESVGFGSYVVFTADAVPPLWQLMAVLVGLPLFAAATAWVALSRSITQPLATRRRAAPRVPRAWRVLIPLIGWAGVAVVLTHPSSLPLTQRAVALAIFGSLVLVGVVLAGGYLVRRGARLMRALPTASATIAGRRLEADAGGGFRAISGIAVALTVTCAVLVVGASQAAVNTVQNTHVSEAAPTPVNDVIVSGTGEPAFDRQIAQIVRTVPGVRSTAAAAFSYRSSPEAVVVGCATLSRLASESLPCGNGVLTTAALGAVGAPITITFPRAVGTTSLKTHIGGHLPRGFFLFGGGPDDVVVPPGLVPSHASLDEHDLLVDTNNSPLVQARLVGRLMRDVVSYVPVYTQSGTEPESGTLQKLELLLTAIVLVVLGIAAAGLAIGAIEGVLERRRTLAHLAATGVSARTLRTSTILEIAAPMTAALILAVAIGIGTGATFIHFYYSNDALTPIVIPWLRVVTIVLAAVAATACVVLVTLPMVGRSIGPENLRTE